MGKMGKAVVFTFLVVAALASMLKDDVTAATWACYTTWGAPEVSCSGAGCDAGYSSFMSRGGSACAPPGTSSNYSGCSYCGSPGTIEDVQCDCTY